MRAPPPEFISEGCPDPEDEKYVFMVRLTDETKEGKMIECFNSVKYFQDVGEWFFKKLGILCLRPKVTEEAKE